MQCCTCGSQRGIAQLTSPLATIRHLDLLIDISSKCDRQALCPITFWVFHYLNKCPLRASRPVNARIEHQACQLAALAFKLEMHVSHLFHVAVCVILENTSCSFQGVRGESSCLSAAPYPLDLPLVASVSLSALKSNPIRYTYVTVPATAIVARVRLTLSAGSRASGASPVLRNCCRHCCCCCCF